MKFKERNTFTKINNDLVEELIADVGLTTAMVYFMIKRRKIEPDNMDCCYPSEEELCEECNLKSRKSMHNHITKLEETGWLKVKSGGSDLGKNSNYYLLKETEMYSQEQLNYINKIERRTNKQEEIPAQDNNIADSVGNVEENIDEIPIQDNVIDFTPKGKVYIDDDLFEEELIPSDNVVPEPIKETTILNNSVGYIEEFYINMHSYYNVDDVSLKKNTYIKNKVNDLVGLINAELTNNNIVNVSAEKIIDDIMKNNMKSFGKNLKDKDDFKKCNYIITCVTNNFKDKKLSAIIKNSKVDNFPMIDQSFIDGLNDSLTYNDNFIEVSNGERESKKEVFRRILLVIENEAEFTKEPARKIIKDIVKFYKVSTFDENSHISMFKDIINKLNDFYGYKILISDRFDGIEIEDTPNIAI